MNQDFLETIKEYLTIREDKFRNSVVIQQNGNIIWNCDTPLEKGFLINAHNPNYIRLCSSLSFPKFSRQFFLLVF